MRTIFVLLISLILSISCNEISTSPQVTDAGLTKSNEKNGLNGGVGTSLQFVAKNSPFVYDFVFSEGKIVGIGTGEKNSGDRLFVLRSDSKSWESQAIDSSGDFGHIIGITLEHENIWVARTDGSIIKKGKSDEKWRMMAKIPESEPTFTAFANSSEAYIVCRAFNKKEGGLRIFKTVDGVESLKKVYENLIAGNPFDLAVIDANTVLIAMNDEYILRTENGGVTWQMLEIESSGEQIGRDDWIRLNRNGASDLEISSNIIWIVGEKGSIYFSEDRGKSWNRPDKLPETIAQQSLRTIAFSSGGKGVCVGENGYIMVSEDFGKNWTELSANLREKVILQDQVTGARERLHKVKFVSEKAMVLGKNGVYELHFE